MFVPAGFSQRPAADVDAESAVSVGNISRAKCGFLTACSLDPVLWVTYVCVTVVCA